MLPERVNQTAEVSKWRLKQIFEIRQVPFGIRFIQNFEQFHFKLQVLISLSFRLFGTMTVDSGAISSFTSEEHLNSGKTFKF